MCGGHNSKHSWLVLLGCMVPLLMIFVLPLLGVREGLIVPIALVAMLLCHLVTAGLASRGAADQGTQGGSHVHH